MARPLPEKAHMQAALPRAVDFLRLVLDYDLSRQTTEVHTSQKGTHTSVKITAPRPKEQTKENEPELQGTH